MTSPPLNCYSGLSNDDFAGWYAVSDKAKCTDFCFWMQSSQSQQSQQQNNNKTNNSIILADPHQTTIITSTNAKWVCLLNGSSNDVQWDDAFQTNTTTNNNDSKVTIKVKVFYDEQIYKFDYLRCNRGAGEQLYSNGQIVIKSVTFWSFVIVFCFMIFILQIYFLRRRRRREFFQDTMLKYNEEMKMDSDILIHEELDQGSDCNEDPTASVLVEQKSEDINPNEIVATPQQHTQQNDSTSTQHNCTKRIQLIKNCSILVVIAIINLFLMYLLFTGILVITERVQPLVLPPPLQSLTPPCSETELFCPIGNIPINNKSINRSKALSQDNVKPFSYIIASDSQLDWYNGESSSIGLTNYPPPCSSTDTCGSCTTKLGTYTNNQMKKSFENLMSRTSTNRPTPRTLVLNGDLTQYFHRHERNKYESIYHSINGLEQFFPSLGNHDYDQKSGATYDNDQWVPPHYCNGKHAVSYIKGAFCNKVPKFIAKERLTRYDPNSLSYSWEEGSYHFVQVHYYPTFENAGLGISSSITWLQRDLSLANEKNLTSVVYVHASSGLPDLLEDTFLNNNVAVIFTGHIHRCLGRKCELLTGLNTFQAEMYFNKTNAGHNNTSDSIMYDSVDKCFPASAALCSRNANANGLFYVKDMSPNLTLPDKKLVSIVPVQRDLCPVGKYGPFLNETDNTSLCQRYSIPAYFPTQPTNVQNKTIPIFWSGSASFETFLVAEFHSDRILVNVMTATEGNEGERYIDTITVPNAIYPFHSSSDIEEQVIYI